MLVTSYLLVLEKTNPRNKLRRRQYLEELEIIKKEYNEWLRKKRGLSAPV